MSKIGWESNWDHVLGRFAESNLHKTRACIRKWGAFQLYFQQERILMNHLQLRKGSLGKTRFDPKTSMIKLINDIANSAYYENNSNKFWTSTQQDISSCKSINQIVFFLLFYLNVLIINWPKHIYLNKHTALIAFGHNAFHLLALFKLTSVSPVVLRPLKLTSC